MSLTDRTHLLTYIKWFAFAICAIGFGWKVTDSFMTFVSRDIGTKTDLKANHEVDLPGFAVCRHPNQIISLTSNGKTLEDSYNLTLAKLKYLEAFRILPEEGIEPILQQFLVNDSNYIIGASIASQGQIASIAKPNLVSKPKEKPEDWPSFFHPLYGICFEFSPEQNPIEYMGSSGIGYVKITANFLEAFPNFEPHSNELNQSKSFRQKRMQNRNGENNLLIVTFEKGSFLTSQQVSILKRGENSQFTLSQDILDKSKTKRIFKCEEYDDDENTEDQCLNDCLVQTFFKEFQCVHPRLKLMDLKNQTYKDQKTCLLEDLESKTAEYSKKLNSNLLGPNRNRSVEEFGLVRIKQILSSFIQDQNEEENRCGCPIKCKRSILSLSILSLGKRPPEIQKSQSGRKSHINYMMFQPYVKVYSYHLLYNGHDLVADIGGYLGLFLGMSIFGFVESIEKALLRKKTSGGKKRSLKRVSSSPVSNGPQRNRRMSLVRRETFEEVEIDE